MAAIPQNLGVPTGTIMWSAAPEVPVGWLLCDGRFVTAADYPALFNALGNNFGQSGDTFQLPDLVGRFIIGAGGLPGADPFIYSDGQNSIHRHGMFADVKHDHEVTDPGHKHITSSGEHKHDATSNHDHPITSDHRHPAKYPSTGVLLATTCSQSIYASPFRGNNACERNPIDDDITYDTATTGITGVGIAVTGTSVELAYTGVTLGTQFTGISLRFSETGVSVDNAGVFGGPQPKNIAFLPIIRT